MEGSKSQNCVDTHASRPLRKAMNPARTIQFSRCPERFEIRSSFSGSSSFAAESRASDLKTMNRKTDSAAK